MYHIINKTTGESETMSERAAIAKYGTDKVNAMMFDMDPEMSLSDTEADVQFDETFAGDFM